MTTLAEFHSDVASALGRGTSLNSVIPTRVRQAVRFIERNYTFQYMRQWLDGTIDITVDDPKRISMYELRPKAIEAFRLISPTDSDPTRFIDLKRVDPKMRSAIRAGVPSAYWLDGMSAFILDAIPEENYEYQIHIVQFTSWQKDEDDFEHWLMDNAEDLLLATSCWYAAVHLRDDRLQKNYKEMRDEAMTTLHIAEQDIQNNDREAVMLWTPTFPDSTWEQDNDIDN